MFLRFLLSLQLIALFNTCSKNTTETDSPSFFQSGTNTDSAAIVFEDKNIKVDLYDLNAPKTPVLSLAHDCDEIILHAKTYTTITYGCCSEEDEIGIYTYDKKRITEANRNVLFGSIPNSPLTIYTAWIKKRDSDSDLLGTLHISYDAQQQDAFQFMYPADSRGCDEFSPIITYQAPGIGVASKVTGGLEFYVGSFYGIEHIDQINDVSI